MENRIEIEFEKYFDKNSRPDILLTDNIWQKIYKELQKDIIPYIDGDKKHLKSPIIKNYIDNNGDFMSDLRTNYNLYCEFINSVLRDIRKGDKAYLFFLYQIKQILCFHNKDLRTRFIDGYWEVWLEKEE